MSVAKQYMLVKINMKMQAAKREKIGNVLLAEPQLEMERYLQFGEILDIGQLGRDKFPEAEIGDTAIFHHTIEDDEWRMIDKDENGDEVRLVDCSGENSNNEIFGFIRGSFLTPAKEYIFINTESVQTIKQKSLSILLKVDDEIWDTRERIEERLDDLQLEIDLLEPNVEASVYDDFKKESERRIEIITAINKIKIEKAELTRFLHRPKLAWCEVAAINSATSEELDGVCAGSIIMSQLPLYPIDLFGTVQFFLCRKENVLCILDE